MPPCSDHPLPLYRAATHRPAPTCRRAIVAALCVLLLCLYACIHSPGPVCCQHSPLYSLQSSSSSASSSASASAQDYYYYDRDAPMIDDGPKTSNDDFNSNDDYYQEDTNAAGDEGDDDNGDNRNQQQHPAPKSNSGRLTASLRSPGHHHQHHQQQQKQPSSGLELVPEPAADTTTEEETQEEAEEAEEVEEVDLDTDSRPTLGTGDALRPVDLARDDGAGDDVMEVVTTTERANLSTANGPGERRLPQAIIIGVKKGGTRALLEFLRLHPDVRAVGSEPHFFDRHYHRGLDWYRSLMPVTLDGQITMEKTPSYFITKEAPERLRAMDGGRTRLIVVVRDPVTRAVSDYTQTLSKRPQGTVAFESLAFRNVTTPAVEPHWSALRIGLYSEHLSRWLLAFPRKNMLFVSGERLVSDPALEVARAQSFLGLKNIVTDKHFYFNATKGFPCLKKAEGTGRPHCLGKTKGRTHPRIDPNALLRLRDFYRPFNRKFYQMVGEDFGWE